jgi:chaperonin GroES
MSQEVETPKAEMQLTVRPLGDRVWIEKIESEQVVGGILIPETYKDQPQFGKVIAAGPGPLTEWPEEVVIHSRSLGPLTIEVRRQKCQVKAGDLVLFGKFAGTVVPVILRGERHEIFMLREEEILAIIKEREVVLPDQELRLA